jgi:hypothetical protein
VVRPEEDVQRLIEGLHSYLRPQPQHEEPVIDADLVVPFASRSGFRASNHA